MKIKRLLTLPLFFLVILTANAQLPIMMYHAHPNFGFSEASFTNHMDLLSNNDYHTITMDRFYDWMVDDHPLPIRPIVLSFDDNYIRVYTIAYPVMKSRGLAGINFAHSDYVGVGGTNDHCDWVEICEMESDGVFLTESHTKTHPHLTSLPDIQATEEIEGSKSAIDSNIPGKICRHIAYPYGDYNPTIISKCQNAGYITGVTTINGFNYRESTPLFELRRIAVGGESVATFQSLIGFNELPPAPPGEGWTIDNGQVNFTADSSEWPNSNSIAGYYGSNYQYHPPGDGASKARWAAYLPKAGRYRIHARWTANPNRAISARYAVHHDSGITTVTVNQQENGGQWNLLGEFDFSLEKPAMVFLPDDPGGYVIADGLWFEPFESRVNGWTLY